MKVRINNELCDGYGNCIENCPDIFEASEDGKAVLKSETVEPELVDSCRLAAEECPTSAINIEE